MIYMVVALYEEAAPFISKLGMKRDQNIRPFQVFSCSGAVLIISGCGPVAAAIGTTYLGGCFPPGPDDVLLNVGTCGVLDDRGEVGTAYLLNKIHNGCSHHTFYPDLLFKNPFAEAGIYTSAVPLEVSGEFIPADIWLVDMEAAGVFQAGLTFFQVHQMHFLKLASDIVGGSRPVRGDLGRIVEAHYDNIITWIGGIHEATGDEAAAFSPMESDLLQFFIDRLKLSVTMTHQARQLLWYEHLRSGDAAPILQEFIGNELSDDNRTVSRREGKSLFEKFKKQLI